VVVRKSCTTMSDAREKCVPRTMIIGVGWGSRRTVRSRRGS
jgi:hypothetical protein